MKLFATVASERATKGQGGNEYLNIEITEGQFHNMIAKIKLSPPKHALDNPKMEIVYNFHFVDLQVTRSQNDFWGTKKQTKGEKQ